MNKTSVNVGAVDINGRRIATKAALRRAVEDTPHSVFFDQTSLVTVDMLPETIEVGDFITVNKRQPVELYVVGPDPYHKRQWYATVVINNKGEVKVK